MTTATIITLREQAAALAESPLAAHPADVWAVAREAERAGVPSLLVDLLLDETAPDVVRRRALGRIGSRLEREPAAAALRGASPAPLSAAFTRS